jgi:hypothetical protein
MKYELISQVIDAFQWTGNNADEIASMTKRKVRMSGTWLVIEGDKPFDVCHVPHGEWVTMDELGGVRLMPAWRFAILYRPVTT